MKVDAKLLPRLTENPDPDVRFWLFAGPDDASARNFAKRIGLAAGSDAERVDIGTDKLKSDPALLTDEAAALSLFGAPRWIQIIVSAGGDDCLPALETLLDAPKTEHPVIAIANGATPRSKLFRLAETHPLARAAMLYMPKAADAMATAVDLGRTLGLQIPSDVARGLVDATNGDRALMAQELEKIALYLDADPNRPHKVTTATLAAIGADTPEEETGAAVNIVLEGQTKALAPAIAQLQAMAVSEIRMLRLLANRVALLARLRVELEEGRSPANVVEAQGKAIFWAEKQSVTRQLGIWDPVRLARLMERLLETERALKAPGNAGEILFWSLLTDISRQAVSVR